MAEVMILGNTDFEGIAIRYQFSQNYDTFTANYKFREESKHPDGLVLRTTLLWISEVESMLSSCSTAVWKVDIIDVRK